MKVDELRKILAPLNGDEEVLMPVVVEDKVQMVVVDKSHWMYVYISPDGFIHEAQATAYQRRDVIVLFSNAHTRVEYTRGHQPRFKRRVWPDSLNETI
jgi:hypothetical protein